jgi:hypothetical protein
MWVFWILPFNALWGENLRWEEGSLVFNLKKDSWPNRTWYKDWSGTAAGHAIMYAQHVWVMEEDSPLHRIQVHEQFHVKQYEAAMLSAFLLGLIVFSVVFCLGHLSAAILLGLGVWLTGYVQMGIGGWCSAWIRGERFYRDSAHEQAAYAVDFKYQRTGLRNT